MDSIEELLDIALACQAGAMPSGDKIGLLTISGGAGVQMADTAEASGLNVAEMPIEQQKYLKELSNTKLKLPQERQDNKHAYYIYVVEHKNRDKINDVN